MRIDQLFCKQLLREKRKNNLNESVRKETGEEKPERILTSPLVDLRPRVRAVET